MVSPLIPARQRRAAALPLLTAALALLGAALGCALGDRMDTGRTEQELQAYNFQLLQRAAAVAEEGQQVLERFRHDAGPCSPADLARLREALFYARYLGDIARVRDGRLACSAIWGALGAPAELPPGGFRDPRGYRFWRDTAHPMAPSLQGDIAANDTMAVFTAPDAFDGYPAQDGRIGSVLLTRNGQYVFRRFPERAESAAPAGGLSAALWPALRARECAAPGAGDICAQSRTRLSDRTYTLILSMAGLAIGALAGVALALRNQQANSLTGALGAAMRRGEIHLVYQPVRELASGRMVAVEALARWTHRDVGPIPPQTFVAWAEATGLGREFTRYVVRTAIHDLRDRLTDDSGFYVTINVSAGDIEDPGFLPYLRETLMEHRVAPSRVGLEITESATFSATDPALELRKYRQLGVKILIDDFGAGYSNLSNLVRWTVDAIKLDRLFIESLPTVKAAGKVLDQVLEMAHQLDLRLIAEGLETVEHANYVLQRLPTACGQGWLLGRPCALQDLPR